MLERLNCSRPHSFGCKLLSSLCCRCGWRGQFGRQIMGARIFTRKQFIGKIRTRPRWIFGRQFMNKIEVLWIWFFGRLSRNRRPIDTFAIETKRNLIGKLNGIGGDGPSSNISIVQCLFADRFRWHKYALVRVTRAKHESPPSTTTYNANDLWIFPVHVIILCAF